MQEIVVQEIIDYIFFLVPVILGIIYALVFIFTIGLSNKIFHHNYWSPFYIVWMIWLGMLFLAVSALFCIRATSPKEMFFFWPNLFGFITQAIFYGILVFLYATLKNRIEKNGFEIRCDLHKRPY